MLTSLPGKINISPESAIFLPEKECFDMNIRLFSGYLSCTYSCIPVVMRKIRVFVHVFSLAPVNGWKYAILGMREMQSVKTETSKKNPYPICIIYKWDRDRESLNIWLFASLYIFFMSLYIRYKRPIK